ncbi:MAG: class I SAM-dependent methyltransferase [Verrucomicrobia bacterium]|nr:class I SAM-dependent methyltransferase [Verrucomicrobiota bacterium]
MRSDVYERYWEPGGAWSPSEHPFYPYERALIEKVGRPGDICLDYGCGDAKRYGKILEEMGFDYRGVDISETAIRQAATLGLNASLLNADGTINLPDETSDFAICFEVFEHLMEADHALAAIYRVLKPGGYLVCSVPNAAYFARRIEFLCTGFLNPKGDPTIERSAPWRDPHIRFFSANILERFIAAHAFSKIKVFGSPFTLDFLLARWRFIQRGSSTERAARALLNSLSWLSSACPALFARRLFAIAQKPKPNEEKSLVQRSQRSQR